MEKRAYYIESKRIQDNPKLYRGIEESSSWIMNEPFIFEYFKKLNHDLQILDIGCGNGSFLDRIKKMGFQNRKGVDLANYLHNKTHLHECVDINVERLKDRDGSFDVVTAFQVLEHLENYFLVVQEVCRVLKKGGLFIFSVPNQFNIFYRIKFALTGNITGWTYENNHLLFVTRDVFRKTFLRDFDLVHVHYNRGPIPTLGRLNIIPGVHLPSRVFVLPRSEAFADRVCYILKKK